MMTSSVSSTPAASNVVAFPKTSKPTMPPADKPEPVVEYDDAAQAKPKAAKKPTVAKAAAPKTAKGAKTAKPAADKPKADDNVLTLKVSDKPLHLLRGRDGAYWLPEVARVCGPIGVFLVNTAATGDADDAWDGEPARALSTWQGGCIDVLHFTADERFAKLIETALKEVYPNATATLMAVETQTEADSKFSPAERTGVAMHAERQAAAAKDKATKKPAMPKGDAAKKPPAAEKPAKPAKPEKAPPAAPPKADKPAAAPAAAEVAKPKADEPPAAPPVPPAERKLTDAELKQELEACGVRRLADLRDLGVRLGFSFSAPKAAGSTPRAAGQIGVWALVLSLMRNDQGATDAEIAQRCVETFGDDKKSTITTNIGALRMLCGGRGAKEAAFTLKVTVDEKRGKVYRLVGARLNDKPGILNEAAKCLMKDEGATEAEVVAQLVATFKDRHAEASLKSTVATQLSMWRSILPAGATEATFSINVGAESKSIYRLR